MSRVLSNLKEYFKSNFVIKGDLLGTLLLDFSYFFLFATLATLPLFTTRDGFTTITNLLSLCSSVLILLYIFFRGRLYFNYFVIFIALFVIYAIISTLFGSKSYSTLKSVVTLYGFSIMVFQFCVNTKNIHFIGMSFLLGIIIFSFIFILQSLPEIASVLKNKTSFDRLGAKFGNINYVGRNFALGSILCTSIAIYKKKRFYLFFILTFVTGACVLLTGSRGAFIIFLSGNLTALFFIFPKKIKWVYFISLIILTAAFFGMLQLPALKNFKDSLERAFDTVTNTGMAEVSAGRRIQMFNDALYIWSKNALFGYGANSFANLSSYGTYSHNSISELLCCFGVTGFFLFYSPIVLLLINIDRYYNEKNLQFIITVISILTAFILVGLFFYVLYLEKIMILSLAVLFAFDFSINKEKENWFAFSFIKKNGYRFFELYPKTKRYN